MRTIAAVLSLVAPLFVACAGGGPADAPAGTQLVLEMRDYTITAGVTTIKAGQTKIGVRNFATQAHSLEILKTDLAPDKLPIDQAKGQAIEAGKVGGLDTIPAGSSKALTLDLSPGHYVVICNVAGHYQLGMRTEITVAQ